MNLKTLYELKEVLDFCGYHDTIVEDMTNRGIDLESLEDKVNHEQKEIEENVYPNLHGTELLNKENISLLGEEILQYFEKTLEEWDKGIIDYDKNTNQLFHNEGKIFSSDVIAWYEGGRTTEDLVKEYSDEKEVEEDREHQILLLLGHAVHLGWNIKHDDEGIYFHKTAPNGLELGVHFDAVDWQYPDTLFDEWIDGNEINKIGNKYIFTAGMELNDFLKMEYLKDFQQGNVNILGVDGKKYISLEDLVNFDVDRYSEKCLNVVYENEKRESQMQEKIMQFHFNLEFVNKKYKNADVVLKVWATEICREQGLSDYYPVQDVKDAFKTMEYIDEKEAVEIVLNDSEETLIYHKSPEEEYFTREALKHETINFDKESEIEEDLDELEK